MRTLICMLLLSMNSSAWAVRVLELAEGAYELDLAGVTFPSSAAGSVVFTPCPDCSTASLRVSAATSYLINGAALPLEDFLRTATRLRQDNAAAMVTVYYDRESHRVTRIAISG